MKIKSIKIYLLAVFTVLFLSSDYFAQNDDQDLIKLKTWMTGSFTSEEQAEADTNFYNIHLEMVQIWESRSDAIWLYVEQAAAWSLDKPYRQRVYRLIKNEDGSFESAVFLFNNPLRFAGAWKEEYPLKELSPDSLSERNGCAIILQPKDQAFIGSTVDNHCSSELRGASYATSQVRIEKNVLTSWDRGFDENGNQVWGAVKGPYIFKKIE